MSSADAGAGAASSEDCNNRQHLSLLASLLGDDDGQQQQEKKDWKNADDLEIAIRQRALSKLGGNAPAGGSSSSVAEIGSFWKRSLDVCRQILIDLEKQERQRKEDGSAAPESSSPTVVIAAPQIAKIPFVLLDDILDILLERDCVAFWNDYVETSTEVMFDLDGSFWVHHSCWLVFLKLCNKLIKRGGGMIPPTLVASVMRNLAAAYPLNDKSATRVWGSRNADTLTEFEDKDEFEKIRAKIQEEESKDSAASTNKNDDFYTLYESFWSLQQDFTSRKLVFLVNSRTPVC